MMEISPRKWIIKVILNSRQILLVTFIYEKFVGDDVIKFQGKLQIYGNIKKILRVLISGLWKRCEKFKDVKEFVEEAVKTLWSFYCIEEYFRVQNPEVKADSY